MKYLICLFLVIAAISAISEGAPKPPFSTYEAASGALNTAIAELKKITKVMPKEKNPSDYSKMEQTASFLSVLRHTISESNFEFLNYSHHYKQAYRLIEKYNEYLK